MQKESYNIQERWRGQLNYSQGPALCLDCRVEHNRRWWPTYESGINFSDTTNEGQSFPFVHLIGNCHPVFVSCSTTLAFSVSTFYFMNSATSRTRKNTNWTAPKKVFRLPSVEFLESSFYNSIATISYGSSR